MTEQDAREYGPRNDRRAMPGADPGQDPRDVDAEYASPDILETWQEQDGIVHPEPGEAGMGTTSHTAPGKDLPHDADPGHDER